MKLNKPQFKFLFISLKRFVPLTAALCGTFVIARMIEFILVYQNHSLNIGIGSLFIGGLLHDLEFSLYLSLALLIPYILADWCFGKKTSYWIFTITGLTAYAIQLSLIRYFSFTLIPLGSDFWAYKLDEITSTVSSTLNMNLIFWLTILFILAFGYILFHLVRNRKASMAMVNIYGIIMLLAVILGSFTDSYFVSDKNLHFVQNKTFLFLQNSTLRKAESFSAEIGNNTDEMPDFPFLHQSNYEQDVLGPFFDTQKEKPNLVFIVFEGLGKIFVGDDARYGGFTPFVDSLANEGLYWPNYLSTTGRTYGLVPTLFGSLPLLPRGFMSMGENMPAHQSLITLLGENGYFTSFFSGYDTSFDDLDAFLKRQDIEFVLNKNAMQQHYELSDINGGYDHYWGFPDKMMFSHSLNILDTLRTNPRLEIYHTLQTHSPFSVPNIQRYEREFAKRLNNLNLDKNKKEKYRTYQKELITFLYTDEALKQFFQSYKNLPEYENTIFFITGDHRLIPIPMASQISRYRVPLIIFSPLLKKPVQFNSVSSLFDITPSLLSFLHENYAMNLPGRAHWIGTKIDTARWFRNIHSIPLMRNKNEIVDYLHDEFYLADGKLFEIHEGLALRSVDSMKIRNDLQKMLDRYIKISNYAVTENQLYSDSDTLKIDRRPRIGPIQFNADSLYAVIDARGLSSDEQFQLAREKAFDGNYLASQAISQRLLKNYPDYHDVRILLGRTYAWEQQYNKARNQFREVIRRDSSYFDSYNALFDVEMWPGNEKEALNVINTGLNFHPEYDNFLAKKAEALLALDRHNEAREVISKLERSAPSHPKLEMLKRKIQD